MDVTITIDRNFPVPEDQMWKVIAAARLMRETLSGEHPEDEDEDEVVLDFAWKLMDNENELFVKAGTWDNTRMRVNFPPDNDHEYFVTMADHTGGGVMTLGFEYPIE